MPKTRRKSGEARAEVMDIIARNDGIVTHGDLVDEMGMQPSSARTFLSRMEEAGILHRRYHFGKDNRGHRVRLVHYVLGADQPPKKKMGRPRTLTDDERKERQRQYQRDYYQKMRAQGKRRPAGSGSWVKDGRQLNRRGRPKLPDLQTKLDVQHRLSQGISVLFPEFDTTNEEHLAWLTYTIEVMSHG